MQTLADRAREMILALMNENLRIIAAAERGLLINVSAVELDRLRRLVAEHRQLIEAHKA
jgi:hypothetical protein